MKVVIFGGSLNPPHLSHEELVARVLEASVGESIWVIPTHLHPFGKPLAAFDDRMAMCRLAFDAFDGVARVLDLERKLGGVSYTVRTVEELQRRHPEITFKLVVGSDVLAERDEWKDFDHLNRLVDFVVVPRAGYSTDDARCLDIPALQCISSSEIRRRIREGEPIDGLVSQAVAAYIRQHRLYRHGDPAVHSELPRGSTKE